MSRGSKEAVVMTAQLLGAQCTEEPRLKLWAILGVLPLSVLISKSSFAGSKHGISSISCHFVGSRKVLLLLCW